MLKHLSREGGDWAEGSVAVRDTSAWALGRSMRVLSSAATAPLLARSVDVVVAAMDDSPRVVNHLCTVCGRASRCNRSFRCRCQGRC